MIAPDASRLAARRTRISDEEYRRRQQKVAEIASARGCELFIGLDPTTIRYLSGYPLVATERPFAVVLNDQAELTLFVPLLKEYDVRMRAKADRVISYREYPGTTHPLRVLADLVSNTTPTRVLLERGDYDVPFGYHGPSLSSLLDMPCEIDRRVIQRLRMVKSDEEIELIRHASLWAVHAQARLEEAVSAGQPESSIAAAASSRSLGLMRELYQDRKMVVSAGFGGQIGIDGTAHHYQQSIDPTVQSGDLMITRVSATIGGYYSDIERTLVCSATSPESAELFRCGVEIQALALDLVKPGVSVAEIDRAVFDRFVSMGIEDCWRHHTGHSLGMLEREAPYVDMGSDIVLEPGMVITIEPGLYRDTVGGFRHSDCVLVTPSGKDILTEWPRDLESLTVGEPVK